MNCLRPFRYAVAFVSFSLASLLLSAQAPGTGAIKGTIFDPTSSAIRGARISVISDSTGLSRTSLTDSFGSFAFSLLTPGPYSVLVQSTGFADGSMKDINVVVGETSVVDVHLSLATVGNSVRVASIVQAAQTESSALGRAVDQEAIEALPLSNRNYTQILSLSPGVVVELPNATALGRGTQDVASNGNKTTGNNIQFNGIDANNLAENSAESDGEEVGVAAPAPDTIEEFKVQTGNYDASYGRGTGANVDVVSKSGTQSFHGSAWEFLRNDVLNANTFFSKLTNQKRPPETRLSFQTANFHTNSEYGCNSENDHSL